MLPVPCAIGGEPILVLITRCTGDDSDKCHVTIVNTEAEGLECHRAEASPPKIRCAIPSSRATSGTRDPSPSLPPLPLLLLSPSLSPRDHHPCPCPHPRRHHRPGTRHASSCATSSVARCSTRPSGRSSGLPARCAPTRASSHRRASSTRWHFPSSLAPPSSTPSAGPMSSAARRVSTRLPSRSARRAVRARRTTESSSTRSRTCCARGASEPTLASSSR